MPRYFFDVRDDQGFHRDEIGDELVDFDEAREQAQSLLPDLAREKAPAGDRHTTSCEVRDETGCIVYSGRLTYVGVVHRG